MRFLQALISVSSNHILVCTIHISNMQMQSAKEVSPGALKGIESPALQIIDKDQARKGP
ncbi:predicted protein [Botrytis cinerea T4]|uniref:Uncharacterized protein n=1 Tax=Botryotinia fuckeliana (strain T4) TaxID=999810 RepID=G2XN78_BOTF4|nr:predicted protein [Botrytis cinerea T4]